MKWISVKDRKPECSIEVLVCDDNGDIFSASLENWDGTSNWCLICGCYYMFKLNDFWMPLPEKPET